jgi:tyrosyl-tRNA synthetase
LRVLQNRIENELTLLVHSQEDLDNAQKASQILFGKSTSEDLKSLEGPTFLDVFEGVPQAELAKESLEEGVDIITALAGDSQFLKSNGEARRALKENSISVNKAKVQETYNVTSQDLINDRYVLLQRGKKTYFILNFV